MSKPVPVRPGYPDYLREILHGLADRSIQSLEHTTPVAYAASELK